MQYSNRVQRREDCSLPYNRIYRLRLMVRVRVASDSSSLFSLRWWAATLMLRELYWLWLVTDFYLLMALRGKNYSFFYPLHVIFRRMPLVLYYFALHLYDSFTVEHGYSLSSIFIDPFIEIDYLIYFMYSFISCRFRRATGSIFVIFCTKFTRFSG